MLNFITTLLCLLTTPALATEYSPGMPVDHIDVRATAIEKQVRQAAVRVTVPLTGGHGSGSYIKYKDVHLVITAQHVVSGPLGTSYLVSYKEESHLGTLIYSDEENDIGILYVGNDGKLTSEANLPGTLKPVAISWKKTGSGTIIASIINQCH